MGQIILVRHGQASWGAADYDVLSPLGEIQAAAVGRALKDVQPTVVVHGEMKRQADTARLAVEAAGWSIGTTTDPRWNEFDSLDVLSQCPAPFAGDDPTAQEFQQWFELATSRWVGGGSGAYSESWVDFAARAMAGLEALADSGTAVVFSSGGPISAVASALLGGGGEVYERMTPVVVNASISKVILGRRGTTLVSFNEHSHLQTGDLLTYR